MKKAFDQTVREIKREVNKKVLKVPGIEQKILDATSNEPWGPHGSLLADIAQATRNYHDYQIIMAVVWKRINDTGKNWRHVYKALTVLEFLVAYGSERVIDEIREHAYQISTLSNFQYIDSSGRDQGSNVRKKSQGLVVLVNDKERIQETRQKAAVNRDKFRNTSSAGGMYRPSSYSSAGGYSDRFDEDHYEGRSGSRDEDRNGYARDREWGYRDDDRYGRYGDSYGRVGDRYSRGSEERYGYKDDDYQGRNQNIDDYQYGSRSRSSDRDRDRAYEDDGQYSSRGGGVKTDDQAQGGSPANRQPERRFPEQNLGVPPSYEEAVGEVRSPVHSERIGDLPAALISNAPHSVSTSQTQATTPPDNFVPPAPGSAQAPSNKEVDGFDEFDPRGSFSAAPTTSNRAEMDLLGSLSESLSSDSLAIVPATYATTASEAHGPGNSGSGPPFVATPSTSRVLNQSFEDPFGNGTFQAMSSTEALATQPQNGLNNNFDFADALSGITYTSANVSMVQVPSTNPQFSSQELSDSNRNHDILSDILPPPGPPTVSQADFAVSMVQPAPRASFPASTRQPASLSGFPPHSGQSASLVGFPPQTGQPAPQIGFLAQNSQLASTSGLPTQSGPASQMGFPGTNGQFAQTSTGFYGNFHPESGSAASVAPHMASQTPAGQDNSMNLPGSGFASPLASQVLQIPSGPVQRPNSDFLNNFLPQTQPTTSKVSQPALPASAAALAIVPQSAKDKFEPKSAVWADTLSRGLVNLNISGSKINPLADIGIDFEAINRKEKRMEKPTTAPATSIITMGKAMGSGSGISRAGASALRAPPNPLMGSAMGMGMGMGNGASAGMGMGGYGGMNRPVGMSMGLNMPVNMGMGQGVQMRPPTGFPSGSTMPGGYNPLIGPGGYAQQPYGGGYR